MNITYNRLHILNIRNTNYNPPPPSAIPEELLRTSVPAWITSRSSERRRRRRERKNKWGKWAGIQARLRSSPDRPALPSLFIANAHSIVNKIDKLRLRLHSNTISGCAFFFTELAGQRTPYSLRPCWRVCYSKAREILGSAA